MQTLYVSLELLTDYIAESKINNAFFLPGASIIHKGDHPELGEVVLIQVEDRGVIVHQ